MRLLVVDDSKAMRMIVVRELRRAGVDVSDVVELDNGPDALDRLREGDIEMVLSDWNMPGMSGLELLQAIRHEGCDVPFGFVTSESAESTHLQALEAGAAFVVTKPFTGAEVARQIDLALGGSGSAGSEYAGAGGEAPSVVTVLEALLRRSVTVGEAPPPRRELPRAFARYVNHDGRDAGYCIAELSLAASAGAALSLVPAATAAEWARSGALPATIQQNFHEVANVLAKAVRGDRERCILAGVTVVADYEDPEEAESIPPGAAAVNLQVQIDGYPSGRMALVQL
ncbi:MAG: response regulator [Acidimicrobiales bacterium]